MATHVRHTPAEKRAIRHALGLKSRDVDHAVNKAPLNSEMCTEGRGSILPAERGSMIGKHDAEGIEGQPTGLEARNAFMQPDDCYDDAGGNPTAHLGRA